MNKKLKRMIATVSAVVTCAVSMASVSVGAVYVKNPFTNITPYTVSFTTNNIKYGLWQEMNDYFNNDKKSKFFISEDGERTIALFDGAISLCWGWDGYTFEDSEDVLVLEKYLSDNNIAYEKEDCTKYIHITLTEYNCSSDEYFQLARKIKEDTGFIQGLIVPAIAIFLKEVTDIEIELPEPTLIGDANEDGIVNISDAVLIMQSITNPNEYKLTIQGIANADVVGDDGVTLLDALRIQEMEAGL